MKQTTPAPGALDDLALGHSEEADVEIVEPLALRLAARAWSSGRRRDRSRSSSTAIPANPLYGGFPITTRICSSRFTRSAASRSSANSGNSSVECSWPSPTRLSFGGRPARRRPSPSARSSGRPPRARRHRRSGTPSSASRMPICRCATTNGAGMISKPMTRFIAARFTSWRVSASAPLAVQRLVDLAQHLDEVGAGAAAGVEHDHALVGEAVGDAELLAQRPCRRGRPCSARPRRACTRRRAPCAAAGRRPRGTARRSTGRRAPRGTSRRRRRGRCAR